MQELANKTWKLEQNEWSHPDLHVKPDLFFFGHLEWKQAANTTLTHYHLIKQIKCVRKHKTTPTILGVPVSERALEPGHPMFYIFNLTLFTPVTVWIAPVNIMAPKQQFRGGVMCWAVR